MSSEKKKQFDYSHRFGYFFMCVVEIDSPPPTHGLVGGSPAQALYVEKLDFNMFPHAFSHTLLQDIQSNPFSQTSYLCLTNEKGRRGGGI